MDELDAEFADLLDEIRSDAELRGVPTWVAAREWAERHRPLCEDDDDRVICAAVENVVWDNAL